MIHPDGLLLGPGGVKGFMELGFLMYMEKHKLLDQCFHFVGVSIGAVICLLHIAGYSVEEIVVCAAETNLFQDFSFDQIKGFGKNAGLISHKILRDSLDRMIEKKYGRVLTLKEFYLATGVTYYATSLRLDPRLPQPVHFSYLTHPDLSCVEAAILSANLPGIFYHLYYNNHKYVDGALGDPYPIHLLDQGGKVIIGVYILTVVQGDNILTYLQQIMNSSMIQLRQLRMEAASDNCYHIALEYHRFTDPVGFGTPENVKTDMVLFGYDQAQRFFEHDHQLLRVNANEIERFEEQDNRA